MTTYAGMPVTGEPQIDLEGHTFLEAITAHLVPVHQQLTAARVFQGPAGHKIKRISIAQEQASVRSTRGGKTYRRLEFVYDTLPDALHRVSTGHTYSYDFAVPEAERVGPEVTLWPAHPSGALPLQEA